jgi:hypothetical protein
MDVATLREPTFSYRISGLAVLSEIELPGLIPGAGSQPDVTLRYAAVPETLPGGAKKGPTWQIAGERFLIHIPSVARFLLTAGREIAVEPAPGTDAQDIAIFLVGTVFGILLHQREQIVLHASAVRVNGKAVLFCGASGAGKSTLGAALGQAGFPLVTDDVCAITLTDAGVPMVHPDGRQLKLWAQAIEKLGLGESQGKPVRNRLEKFYVEPDTVFSETLPLGAVYALREARVPHAPGIERPNIVDAALILRRNAYRPLLVSRMDQKARYFHAATAIANKAGIFHLTRKLDFAAMPDVTGWLRRHWSDIGLTEKTV